MNPSARLDEISASPQTIHMNINSALEFFISNITHFIGAFFVVVLFLFAVSIYLGLKDEKANDADKSDLKGLEETLRKVIDAAPTQGGASDEEMKKLRSELSLREKELQELKNSFETAKESLEAQGEGGETSGGGSPVLDLELQKKIEDLEARLAEYEIIEDDIANLSVYKEENTNLKKEIEALKSGGGAQAADPPPPPDESDMPTPTSPEGESDASGEDIMAEFAQAVGGEEEPAQKVEEEAPSAEAIPESKLESAPEPEVKSEEKPEEKPQTPEPSAETKSEEAAPVAESAPAQAEASPDEEPAAKKAAEEKSDEAAAEASPSKEEGDSPFTGELDTDKLVAEATSLEGIEDTDDDEDEGDVGQKLISEFEEFVKKEDGA